MDDTDQSIPLVSGEKDQFERTPVKAVVGRIHPGEIILQEAGVGIGLGHILQRISGGEHMIHADDRSPGIFRVIDIAFQIFGKCELDGVPLSLSGAPDIARAVDAGLGELVGQKGEIAAGVHGGVGSEGHPALCVDESGKDLDIPSFEGLQHGVSGLQQGSVVRGVTGIRG